MQKMPYQPALAVAGSSVVEAVVTTDWQRRLPTLKGRQVVLRELRASDAISLHALLTTEEGARFISQPPTTVDVFEMFIAWTHRQRAAGTYACFAATLHGFDTAIGIFQVRGLGQDFENAEWGFALGARFWETGVFHEGAQLVLDLVFETLVVHRLEARAALPHKRASGA